MPTEERAATGPQAPGAAALGALVGAICLGQAMGLRMSLAIGCVMLAISFAMLFLINAIQSWSRKKYGNV